MNINRFVNHNYFEKCIELFDKNDYPIIIILERGLNYNPYINSQQELIELISPLTSISYYYTKKVQRSVINSIKVDYGEKNTAYMSYPESPSFQLNQELNLKKQKRELKHKRKPTDILVFNDGALFSESAIFMKYFQYYGSGIVTGYLGNPKYYNITPFDSAQSPSKNLDNFYLNERSIWGHKLLDKKYYINLDILRYHYYYDYLNLTFPIEFSVTPVDEIVDILEYLNDNNYQLFINKGKEILQKYEKFCNPRNKKLVLVNKECYNKFGNSYTHGGYLCGEDGKWSNRCVPSYCDEDYYFNHYLKKCILKSDKKLIWENNNKFNNVFDIKYIFEIMSIFIIVFIFIKNKRKRMLKIQYNDNDNQEEELIDIE